FAAGAVFRDHPLRVMLLRHCSGRLMNYSPEGRRFFPSTHLTRINVPVAPGAWVGKRTRNSGCSGGLTEDVAVNLMSHAYLGKRLVAADRQLKAVGIEVDLHVPHGSVFIPAVRAAPVRQVEP